ncbi:class I SAM-dependent methyltransferase [Pseudomonas frederiksbergensis]|uniref:class I SAM-dependent methyltransferase n=1 Tax=Pseudomonas frederiksbergensis TaxID=104087 RepID=UPI003D230860
MARGGFGWFEVERVLLQCSWATKQRLGSRADEVRWIAGDITKASLPPLSYDVWHDRAVFHFLIAEADREAYVQAVLRCVKPGGFVIVATSQKMGRLTAVACP